jgi:hypothetical protein
MAQAVLDSDFKDGKEIDFQDFYQRFKNAIDNGRLTEGVFILMKVQEWIAVEQFREYSELKKALTDC